VKGVDKYLDEDSVLRNFKYPDELYTIFSVTERYLERYKNTLNKYPLPINPFAFMLAIRMAEQGRKGIEFGVLHPDAINTDLEEQAIWSICTIIKNSVRWHMLRKQNVELDYITYFGGRWCPIGASNDPTGLNKHWVSNARYYYSIFNKPVC
jgi:hypothetical protein